MRREPVPWLEDECLLTGRHIVSGIKTRDEPVAYERAFRAQDCRAVPGRRGIAQRAAMLVEQASRPKRVVIFRYHAVSCVSRLAIHPLPPPTSAILLQSPLVSRSGYISPRFAVPIAGASNEGDVRTFRMSTVMTQRPIGCHWIQLSTSAASASRRRTRPRL